MCRCVSKCLRCQILCRSRVNVLVVSCIEILAVHASISYCREFHSVVCSLYVDNSRLNRRASVRIRYKSVSFGASYIEESVSTILCGKCLNGKAIKLNKICGRNDYNAIRYRTLGGKIINYLLREISNKSNSAATLYKTKGTFESITPAYFLAAPANLQYA